LQLIVAIIDFSGTSKVYNRLSELFGLALLTSVFIYYQRNE